MESMFLNVTGRRARRLAPPLAAGLAFLLLALLYVAWNRPLYMQIVTAWGVRPYIYPFLDTETVLSALRCLRDGVDVFVSNPCDPRHRIFDYSPLWLAAAPLPVTTAWIAPVGLAVDTAFLLSLFLLPPGRTARETAVIVAGTLSTATAYALERGNNDLVIFVLAACAASLVCRSPALRYAGYGLAFLAGLLKYYPMALMALALREAPKIFGIITLAATLGLLIFIAIERHDLLRALFLIPHGSFFSDMFGASTLPGGLAQLLHLKHRFAANLQRLLVLAALVWGGTIGLRAAFAADLAALTAQERVFLLAGALLILGCYLTAQNIGYRAINLLLILPGVTSLSRVGGRSWVYGLSAGLIVLLLWAEGWHHWLSLVLGAPEGPAALPTPPLVAAWGVRELAWWWVVTLLFALLCGLLNRTDIVRITHERLLGLWRPRPMKKKAGVLF